MNYPREAGFQSHSETSCEAAEKLSNASQQRDNVLSVIRDADNEGATTDFVRNALLIAGKIHENSVMSARVRELELHGDIVKTTVKRKTKAGRNANVYVTKNVFARGRHRQDAVKEAPAHKVPSNQKERLKELLNSFYHEHDGSFIAIEETANKIMNLK